MICPFLTVAEGTQDIRIDSLSNTTISTKYNTLSRALNSLNPSLLKKKKQKKKKRNLLVTLETEICSPNL